MVRTQPFPIADFTGGFTDNYINAPLNQAQEVVNLLIQEDKSVKTRPGSHVDDETNSPLPVGQQRIGHLINYDKDDKLFVQSANRLYYRDPATYSTLQGPVDSNNIFPTATITDHINHAEWKKHVFVACDNFESVKKIYKDNAGDYQLRTAGLPDLASDPTITPGAAGSRTYLYAFHFHYTYFVGSQEFQDFGPTTVVEVTASGDPSSSANAITSIPTLANSTTESWDTANIKVYIYRTIDGGTTLYKVGEVTNGTTTFNDNTSDDDAQLEVVIYTEGDVLDNDPPPSSKYVHVVNNTGYYAHLKEGTEVLPGTVRQSVPFDPDSVPAANNIVVEDDVMGISSIQSIPVVGCRKHIYRIDGAYDEVGRGAPVAIRIDDTAGVVSQRSMVQAKSLLFWMGNDKVYATDGYKVTPVSDHFHERYKAMLDATADAENIVGTYDEKAERIYWTVQRDSSSGDVDTLWVLDLRWGVSKSSSFTELSGSDSFAPSAITFLNDELVRADKRGYVFIHSETDENDPKVDLTDTPDNWVNQAISWQYKSFATNFGTDFLRKWVPRLNLTAVNQTNVSIGIFAINDDGRSTREMKQIRYRRNFTWGDIEFVWGDSDFVWNAAGLIQETRRLPSRGMRCSYFQLQLQNAHTAITDSDTIGTATVAGTVATLDTAADSDWPLDSVDYYISFEQDGYVKEYLITLRTDDTITFLDTGGTAPTGSTKWEIRGIRKSEVFNLRAFTIHQAAISQSDTMFEAGGSGGNA